MNDFRKILSSLGERQRIERLIKKSPSPSLAQTNLLRLIESGGLKSLKRFPRADLPVLFQLLGASAYLSDILIREGRDWPDLFLRQIKVPQKTSRDYELRRERIRACYERFFSPAIGVLDKAEE